MAIRISLANYQDIDGLLWGGWRWEQTDLTYSFPTTSSQYGGYLQINGLEVFNAAQQAESVRAIKMYGAVCGLTFTKAANPADGNIRMAEATTYNANDGNGLHGPGGGVTAEANPPDDADYPNHVQGDSWFTHSLYNAPKPGNFASAAGIIHEIGHALGLKHGHAQNKDSGFGSNFITLPFDHDSQEYSIMTYKAFVGQQKNAQGFFNEPEDFPTTLMQADIIALQWLYGADYNYNSGNTTYKWNSSNGEMLVNGHRPNGTDNLSGGVHPHKKIFMTVWDGNGVDTYDFSNFSTRVRVDLNPGGWSTPDKKMLADLGSGHVARGSIANAQSFFNDFRCYIENANGGSNNDTISGNLVANTLKGNGGHDRLNGFAGADSLFGLSGHDIIRGGDGDDLIRGGTGIDTLRGGFGVDTFDFNSITESGRSTSTRDVIVDFDVNGDELDFSSIDAKRSTAHNDEFSFIRAKQFTKAGQIRVQDSGDDVIIQLNTIGSSGAELTVLLKNVQLSGLSVSDFDL